MDPELHVVTGAFGFTGKYIARRLLDAGVRVRTLTNNPHRPHPFGDQVEVYPYNFNSAETLAESLRGVSVLYNTYWVRYDTPRITHADAARHSRILFMAARAAGVARIVHLSITNASSDSPVENFRLKFSVEEALRSSEISHAILRPSIIFGEEDTLINNLAWTLRNVPVFGLFGMGNYRVRPVYVDDLAALAVAQGKLRDRVTMDAVGPEAFAYRDLIAELARIIGVERRIIPLPPQLAYLATRLMGRWLGDTIITRDELAALRANLLTTDGPATCPTALTTWAAEHAATLGLTYRNEHARREQTATTK